MNAMAKEFDNDETLREKQYKRLCQNTIQCDTLDGLVTKLSDLSIETSIKQNCEWWEYEASDEIVTFIVDWSYDLSSQRWFVSLCTRSREMRNKSEWEHYPVFFVVRAYRSSNGLELFCSFEDTLWYLYGFTRLLLPKAWTTIEYPWLWADTAMIRELHVYGTVQSIDKKSWNSGEKIAQHWWFWTQLLAYAEAIAWSQWFKKLSVISGIWVRAYYQKKWYGLVGTYMVKEV